MSEPDLFGFQPPAKYPEAPGHKGKLQTGTDAAARMETKAGRLHAMILTALARRSMTPDECAASIGQHPMDVRPRFSELAAMSPPRIVPTGEKRPSARGNPQAVWSIA